MTTAPTINLDEPAARTEEALSVDEVLERAQASNSSRTRSLAARLGTLLADLTGRVRAELEAGRAKAEADRARARLADQEAELTAQLAEIRQQMRKTHRPVGGTSPAVDPKTVRAWAAENGIECAAKGRLPQRVVEAWRDATAGTEVLPR